MSTAIDEVSLRSKPEIRRGRIVKLVSELSTVSVDELATRLGASKETIRRDLAVLADEGRIRKTHGSAAVLDRRVEGPFSSRMAEAEVEKRRIAGRAAALFERGDTLFVDTGTTTLYFAESLAERSGLTVITNSLLIAEAISKGGKDNKVFLLGGEFLPDAHQTVGPLTLEQISRFNTNHVVLTVGAISNQGIMDFSIEEVEVARAMILNSRLVTVIADSSKLEREALFLLCSLDRVDRLIVDKAPSMELAEALKQAGVDVLIAD